MTKCSALPRGLGTLPAGSAVRVKSRFALYSVSGAAFAARVEARFAVERVPLFAAAPAPRFAVVPALRFVAVPALRFAVVPAPRLAPVAELRFAADLLARAGRVLLAVRLVAM